MWFCWVHPVFSISISIHAEEMTKTWTAGGAFKPWPLNFAGEAQGLNDAIDVPEPQPRTHPLAEPEDAPSAKIKEATIGAMVDTFHFSGCSLINLWHERSPNGSRKVGPHHRWYIYIINCSWVADGSPFCAHLFALAQQESWPLNTQVLQAFFCWRVSSASREARDGARHQDFEDFLGLRKWIYRWGHEHMLVSPPMIGE